MCWLLYLQGQAEAQSNAAGHVRLIEGWRRYPLCRTSQPYMGHLQWYAGVPTVLRMMMTM